MKKLNHSLCLLFCLLCLALPHSLRAETLDEASLRKIYADAEAVIRDPVKTRHIMEERLDETFQLKNNLALILGNQPPTVKTSLFDKTNAINDVVESSNTMTIGDYHNTIVNIKFSDDKKLATVSDTTKTSGTMLVPVSEGHTATASYTANQACLDLLTLVGTQIKFLKSECNNQLTLTK